MGVGRSPPSGPRYVAPARIQGAEERWPAEAWSIVVDFDPGQSPAFDMEVSVRLLAPETAPRDLLELGKWFELYEGARRVAVGTIVRVSENEGTS